jgi:8-oxo-dGTP pyrophosphatase MutT (NUDIX family)
VRRELREELGIEVEIQTVFPPIVHTYDHATVRIFPAVCRLAEASPEPRALDVAAWEWRSLADLPWEEFLPANVRVVTALMRHLGS